MTKKSTNTASEIIELDAAADGTPYLDGMKPKVVEEIWDAAKAYHDAKEIHASATDDLKERKIDLIAIAKKHRDKFTEADIY